VIPTADGGTVPVKSVIYEAAFASWLEPANASLAFALAFVLVWTFIVWALYQTRTFIKV
jgi:predicted acyltransferase